MKARWELPGLFVAMSTVCPRGWGVLEELEDVVGAGNAQLDRLDDAVGEGDDVAEVLVGDLASPDLLAAEQVAIKFE